MRRRLRTVREDEWRGRTADRWQDDDDHRIH
jgi:hypothetical protein